MEFTDLLDTMSRTELVAWSEFLVTELDIETLVELLREHLYGASRAKLEELFKDAVLDNMGEEWLREFILEHASEKVRNEIMDSYYREVL